MPDAKYAELPEPLEIEWPELNSHALGCGVEDRGLHNRYECAEYGWQDGVDKAAERVPEQVYDADRMRAFADATHALRTAHIAESPKQERVYVEGGRESVEDALAIVESFGVGTEGLNDEFARQVILAAEVRRLRGLYEQAVLGRAAFRQAYRKVRALPAANGDVSLGVTGAVPVAVLRFERGTSGRENEMPRVVSCDWLPDGEYHVYLATQPAAQQGEPFGYFRAEPFGWTDCAEGEEGAVALYEKAGVTDATLHKIINDAARTQQEER